MDSASPPPTAPTPSMASPFTPTARPLRILLVIDHEDTRRVLTTVLCRSGYEVFAACNNAQALELAAANPYDVLLVNRALPDGLGVELFHQLRQQRPIEALVMSGYGSESDHLQSKEAGFREHLVKPINVSHLRQILDEIPRLDD